MRKITTHRYDYDNYDKNRNNGYNGDNYEEYIYPSITKKMIITKTTLMKITLITKKTINNNSAQDSNPNIEKTDFKAT